MSGGEVFTIRADILNPTGSWKAEHVRGGELAFDDRGVIVHCGRTRAWRRRVIKVDAPKQAVIIPGLIDCHTHLSQYHVRGRTGHTLMQWLADYVFPAEASFRNRGYARKVAEAFFQKLLSNGVTTSALYANCRQGAEEAMEAAEESGIRALVGLTMMDRNVPRAIRQRPEAAMEDCRNLDEKARSCKSGRVRFSVNPRFAPACTGKYMAMIGRFAAERGVYVQTHLSENMGEIALARRLFPWAGSYAEVYDRFGLLGEKTLLAHCIHLSADERRIIRRRGCAVVHCPSSNLFLHSGRFPVELWENYPKLALGTDVGAGPSFSMLDTMRDAYYVNQRAPEWLFHRATMGAAAAMGLEKNLGSLEMGKQADFSVVTVGEGTKGNGRELLSDLIFKWDQVRFRRVYVAGREVWRG